jgi:hypothetical protein
MLPTACLELEGHSRISLRTVFVSACERAFQARLDTVRERKEEALLASSQSARQKGPRFSPPTCVLPPHNVVGAQNDASRKRHYLMPLSACRCDILLLHQVPPRGLECTTNSLENPGVRPEGGAKSGALSMEPDQIDTDLAEVIEAWPNLSGPIRAGILAIVRAGRA